MVVQPGASVGQRTYCPVSGVVFDVKPGTSRRDVAGKPLWFCCESCASYFSSHTDAILAARAVLRTHVDGASAGSRGRGQHPAP